MWFIPTSTQPWQIAENVSVRALKLFVSLNSLFFSFYFAMCTLYCVIICVPVLAWKRNWLSHYSIILLIPVVWKKLCWCTKRVYFVSLGNFGLKIGETKTVFVSKYRGCKASPWGRISILINRNYCSGFFFSRSKKKKKDMDRNKKLNSILRRHYGFVMTALGENIICIGTSRHYKAVMSSQNRI